MIYRTVIFFVLCTTLFSCGPTLPPDIAAAYKILPDKIDFNQDVKPILSDRCFSCHGPDKEKQKAGLRLDLESSAFGELPESPGKRAIVPGNLEKSELFKRIISIDPKYLMPEPKSHLLLSATDKAILIKWIKDGAKLAEKFVYGSLKSGDKPDAQYSVQSSDLCRKQAVLAGSRLAAILNKALG